MTERPNHFAAASANDIPVASNLNTDSKVSGLKSESFSSPHVKFEAQEKSIESVKPGPPILIQSESTKSIPPAKPPDSIQEDSIRTEMVVSSSRQPDKIKSASAFDDSMFISICHFYGLEYAKSKAERKGWHLSKPPESLLEDEVQRRAEWYRAGMVRGFAVLPAEQKTAIKARTFRSRQNKGDKPCKSMYNNESVPLFTDTRETFKQRLTSDCRRVRDLRKEKADLADAYNRYVSIQAELKQKEKNIDRLMAILGDSGFAEARREDKSKAIEQVAERHLSEQLPLWEAVQIYLDVTGEAKMMDVLLFLRWYAVDASREAVESALRTHKDVFQTRKVGREKFISLKGA